MLPENIDDLFRDKLDGHQTPPGDDLWARLQASPAKADTPPQAERLDQLFASRLSAHATPPRRELWERLEDEHLRPRKRRAAAWWPMALAAAVVLFLLVGGAGLWLGVPAGTVQQGSLASSSTPTTDTEAKPAGMAGSAASADKQAATLKTDIAVAANEASDANSPLSQNTAMAAVQKKVYSQATRPEALASTAPKALMTAASQQRRHPQGMHQQPDAAATALPLVAHQPAQPTATDEQRTAPALQVAALTSEPAAEIVRATPAPNTMPVLAANELITVDVRNGAAPVNRPARIITSALAAAETTDEPRRLTGRLLQQAGHLVRGERVSLAEVTGLPENLTLRATFAGRSVSKSIQL